MITIDDRSPVPIYEQVKMGLRGLVVRGLLKPGDQIPPIRNLAEQLFVNPNTIARAYRELALEGFLDSKKGEGNYISAKPVKAVNNGLGVARQHLLESLRAAHRSGLTWKEIQLLLQLAKSEEES